MKNKRRPLNKYLPLSKSLKRIVISLVVPLVLLGSSPCRKLAKISASNFFSKKSRQSSKRRLSRSA